MQMKQSTRIGDNLPKLAAPARRTLHSAGITQLKQLASVTEDELMQLHGMGRNALGTLRETLKAEGLSFREPKKSKAGTMDKTVRTNLDNIRSTDGQLQNKAYMSLMQKTEKPVDWAYEAWDELIEGLTHKDNHVRAICGQLLGNLGKSDPKGRMFKDFDKLLNVTRDEKFVTARHTLQSMWKIGIETKMRKTVVEGLAERFKNCAPEKNCRLIRYDIIQDLRNLYDEVKDEKIKQKALALIETEDDLKYKKKYAGVWK